MNELKTIRKTLNNTTTEFKFDEVGAKFLIKNFSENDCYVCFDPTAIATNSVKISAGKAFLLMTDEYKPEGTRSVYVLGTGEIEVRMVLKYWRSGGNNTVFSGSQYFMNVHKSEGGGSSVVANPTLAGTEDALTGLQVGNTKYKVDSGISQADADARYLKLTGGTMAGDITMNANIGLGSEKAIKTSGGFHLLSMLSTNVSLGNTSKGLIIHTQNESIYHDKNGTTYDILDTSNGLPLSGGTMSGDITIANNKGIKTSQNHYMVSATGDLVKLGQANHTSIELHTAGNAVQVYRGGWYNVLDSKDTQANPTLSGTETALTSLKLNGTNYAIAGGTQVTFVDWS